MAGKTIFADTNIGIDDPYFLRDFLSDRENKVVLADVVVSEMNGLKKNPDVGKFAREFNSYITSLTQNIHYNSKTNFISRIVDWYNDYDRNKLIELVDVEKQFNGKVYVSANYGTPNTLKFNTDIGENDLKIIRAAKIYKINHPDENVVLVSADTNVITVARLNGIPAEYLRKDSANPEKLSKGFRILDPSAKSHKYLLEKFMKNESIPLSEISEEWSEQLIANEYVICTNEVFSQKIEESKTYNPKRKFSAVDRLIKRYDLASDSLVDIGYKNKGINNIFPKNLEQLLLMDQLSNKDILVKATMSNAGTGKTFIELAVALDKVIKNRVAGVESKVYVIRRDTLPEEQGFLPGDLIDKNKHLYRGIAENYSQIMKIFIDSNLESTPTKNYSNTLGLTYSTDFYDTLDQENALINLLPFADIRGRTIGPDDIVIAEEWQNTEIQKSRIMMSRNSNGEVYLNGDPWQIDNPYNSKERNGIAHAVQYIESKTKKAKKTKNDRHIKSAAICATLRLRNNERGLISEWAEDM
ncbi:MAG TPA: PhoH family protein [Alphaproteobacteria bacterium]|nr:PhoH family protein [Alphaproteobacteria bacterium]